MTTASSQTHRPASRLLLLPMEIRFQVYEWLLPSQGFLCDNEHAAAELNCPFDEEPSEADGGVTFDSLRKELTVRNHANPHQPFYEDRSTYGKLLLVCKTVHSEAAPLFFRKVTFFIIRRDPFEFANKFLRKLSVDKISSLRHLELKSHYVESRCSPSSSTTKLLYHLKIMFQTYKELRCLESFTFTLTTDGRACQIDGQPSLIFRPASDYGRVMVWEKWTKACMWNTGLALLKIMGVTQFELSKSVEDVYERVAPNQHCVAWRGRVARVKLQRK